MKYTLSSILLIHALPLMAVGFVAQLVHLAVTTGWGISMESCRYILKNS